jgi:transcriptional regulator with XRE-family HTH domain
MAIFEFWDWVEEERLARNLTVAEMERRAGVGNGTISAPRKAGKAPTEYVCDAIARSLKIPKVEVLRHAGMLPSVPQRKADDEELLEILSAQSDAVRRVLLAMLRGLGRKEPRAVRVNEGRPGYEAGDPLVDELVAAFRELPREAQEIVVQQAVVMRRLATQPAARIIGDEDEDAVAEDAA